MTTPFPFDVRFQRSVLRLVMIDDGFAARAFKHVDPGFFTSRALGWMFLKSRGYWETYSRRVSDLVLRDMLRNVEAEHVAAYSAEIDEVVMLGQVPDADYIKQELREFVRRALFSRAHAESATAYNEGKTNDAYAITMKALESINAVDFDVIDRQWFFEEFGDRQRERFRKAANKHLNAFSTGIPDIDRLTDGGGQRGEVWLIAAEAKVGKTTWLINQGGQAAQIHGARVAHFILEGKGEQTADRYEAFFTNCLYTDVKRGDVNAKVYAAIIEEYERLRRRLVLRTMNDWDTTVIHIETELKQLRAEGFIPDVIVIDYLDLLRARNAKGMSETDQQVEAARDTKKLAIRNDALVWTASQMRRPKEGDENVERVLRVSAIADAYAKKPGNGSRVPSVETLTMHPDRWRSKHAQARRMAIAGARALIS